ncbi:helix-turn-helix transcriptional regulator [Cellulomonas fimi]|uniref:Helix-turn-helix type 11 domain protein n=1 Tax=Cellulomonas fimi (strain ATCC 484 / DSM 20113 / JCM 1341 / CCUG 24087 / LMG 16345 / NBRC 15513 / NCIMB 8980 / NCTC 7547 / NRS-133) TaxID=590998 RepID=F4H420_CELFA|nr:WYL domain-containing protein [Cellulomonas fimi]AEE45372.1 helix-turn-helix type 11 domain protein [Cellulomonas fimi ATCC 484]NNH06874.1 WYL domain-containing protein [Cellulomonas fimi]VEH29151.1 Proteasome accessory factor B [Cellulomonas fimi]
MSTPSARLLSLLSLLQARRDWPGDLLADRLGVSPRTVRRDVDRLRDLGYPVRATKGPDGGYRLDAGSHMPPLLLDDEQVVALVVALRTASTGIAGVDEAAVRALTTVRQVMPARLRAAADALQVTAVARGPRPDHPEVSPDTLLAVGTAVRAREVLRFDYDGGSAPAAGEVAPPRRAEPHHLVTWGGRWYLVGWDLDRADWRTFRVDRMTPRTPTGPRFTPRELPGGDVAGFVAAKFGQSVDWPCVGEVVLDMPADAVRRWAGRGALVEDLGDGRTRLVQGAWSWDGLAAVVALFGADLRVVGPDDLRAAVARLTTRLTAALG